MASEEQSKLMEVLVKNQAVQLQVVKENDVYKNFKPPDLPEKVKTNYPRERESASTKGELKKIDYLTPKLVHNHKYMP